MANLKPHISLFDKSFSEHKTADYALFLQLSKKGFSYTLLNVDQKTFIALESYLFHDVYTDAALVEPLRNLLATLPLLKKKFHSFQVTFINNRATLIPNAVFKTEELASYHRFNFINQEEDLFFNDALINLSAHNVYSAPDYIVNEFKHFQKVSFKHFSTSLIESSLLHAKTTHTLSLIDVHVLPESFQIIIIKNQQLALYNFFEYQTSEDFIYYLLFVLDQLNIDNEEASIRLLGEVEKNSAIYLMINKYIKTITFAKSSESLRFSYVFNELPQHTHYSLFNQFL